MEERTHIARELHDVVAHHVSLDRRAGRRGPHDARRATPTPAEAALGQIEDASREAVGEMRQLLDVLRAATAAPDAAPQPGLASLDGLVAGFRAAGLDVAVSGSPPAGLAPALDLTLLPAASRRRSRTSPGTRRPAVADVALGEDGPWVQHRGRRPGPAPAAGQEGAGRGGLSGWPSGRRCSAARSHAGPTPDGGFAVVGPAARDGEPAR